MARPRRLHTLAQGDPTEIRDARLAYPSGHSAYSEARGQLPAQRCSPLPRWGHYGHTDGHTGAASIAAASISRGASWPLPAPQCSSR